MRTRIEPIRDFLSTYLRATITNSPLFPRPARIERVGNEVYGLLEKEIQMQTDWAKQLDRSKSLIEQMMELRRIQRYDDALKLYLGSGSKDHTTLLFLLNRAFSDGNIAFVETHMYLVRQLPPVCILGLMPKLKLAKLNRERLRVFYLWLVCLQRIHTVSRGILKILNRMEKMLGIKNAQLQ